MRAYKYLKYSARAARAQRRETKANRSFARGKLMLARFRAGVSDVAIMDQPDLPREDSRGRGRCVILTSGNPVLGSIRPPAM